MTRLAILTIVVYISCLCTATSAFGFFNNDNNGGSRAKSTSEADSNTELGAVTAENHIIAKDGVAVAHNYGTNAASKAGYNEIYEAVTEAVLKAEKYGYFETAAETCGEAICAAVAQAFAIVKSHVHSTGDSTICSSTTASAQERATAYADVIVAAFAKASNLITFTTAESAALARAISSRTADAFAKANSEVCLYGPGHVTTVQTTFAEAAFEGYAYACTFALAKIYDYKGTKVVHEKKEVEGEEEKEKEEKVSAEKVEQAKAVTEAKSEGVSEHDEDFKTKKTFHVQSDGNAHIQFNPETRTVTNGHVECEGRYAKCCEKPYQHKCDCGSFCTMHKFTVEDRVYYRKDEHVDFSHSPKSEYECICLW